jgi:hypothetical protein
VARRRRSRRLTSLVALGVAAAVLGFGAGSALRSEGEAVVLAADVTDVSGGDRAAASSQAREPRPDPATVETAAHSLAELRGLMGGALVDENFGTTIDRLARQERDGPSRAVLERARASWCRQDYASAHAALEEIADERRDRDTTVMEPWEAELYEDAIEVVIARWERGETYAPEGWGEPPAHLRAQWEEARQRHGVEEMLAANRAHCRS